MNIHITKTYNIGGKTGIRQNSLVNAGRSMGCKEMSLFKFPDGYDTDEQLHVRMDGIIASLCMGDIVIFQYPSGISARYDRFLIEHLRRYAGVRLVICVQEVASEGEDSKYKLEEELALLNQADLLIMPSEEMQVFYQRNGLQEKPVMLQKWYDYMTDVTLQKHEERRIYILSEELEPGKAMSQSNVEILPFDEYHVPEMLLKIAEGGIGLIWNFDGEKKDILTSWGLMLGLFLTAGIPVIVQKGAPCEEYVEKHGVGFVAESMEDVYRICAALSDEDFDRYYANVRKLQYLFTSGAYTKRLLQEILIDTLESL